MPKDRIKVETDQDPRTVYEDTAAHKRPGMVIDDAGDRQEVDSPQIKK